jgi:hypothetical protein
MRLHSLFGRMARAIGCVTLLAMAGGAQAAETYKPFVVSTLGGTTVESVTKSVIGTLKAHGLEVVGQYSPYADGSAVIVGATSKELRDVAGSQPYGGFGGVVRVAVTNNKGAIEVSYVNPVYMGYAYHLGDLTPVADEFAKALGRKETFGAEGLTADKLDGYHYMMFMPYFKDRKVIARFDSHEEAVRKVEQALNSSESDMSPVWEVRISPDQMLFGVQLHRGKWANDRIKKVMDTLDTGTPRSTASLPWELLVNGKELIYLPGKYRIAIMFPDLTMGTFMKIAGVPDDMADSASALADIIHRIK